jgi:hypothetical protein
MVEIESVSHKKEEQQDAHLNDNSNINGASSPNIDNNPSRKATLKSQNEAHDKIVISPIDKLEQEKRIKERLEREVNRLIYNKQSE